MQKPVKFAVSLLVLMLLALLWFGRQFLAVDACLDSGGSYDYEAETCDYSVNHPSASELKSGQKETR